LTELVKNAYDADSSLVKISIVPEGTSTRIVVEDNGQGMTIDDTWAYWMRIGTGNKVDNPISQVYGRRKTGAKGVGRFACRRLGLNLELVTTAQIKARKTEDNSLRGKFQTTSIIFNWENFKRGKSVEDIVSEGSTTFSDVGITGTKLQI
jgi:DNA topoisomerase VI subunit B